MSDFVTHRKIDVTFWEDVILTQEELRMADEQSILSFVVKNGQHLRSRFLDVTECFELHRIDKTVFVHIFVRSKEHDDLVSEAIFVGSEALEEQEIAVFEHSFLTSSFTNTDMFIGFIWVNCSINCQFVLVK